MVGVAQTMKSTYIFYVAGVIIAFYNDYFTASVVTVYYVIIYSMNVKVINDYVKKKVYLLIVVSCLEYI